MAPDPRGFIGVFRTPRNAFESKWNILFDKDAKEWIAFKPALGLYVYPCYSCRHMFFSKKSFLDHVNRRAVVLQYKCPSCNNNFTFYNRCSFLLHCRKHFSLDKGVINLNNLSVSTLPFGLAGFARHPDVPYLFDVEEDVILDNMLMNAQFYTPKIEDKGKELISLVASHLVINRSDQNGENQTLALKQVAKNIPKCQFISLQSLKEMSAQIQAVNGDVDLQVEIKSEPEEPQNGQMPFSEESITSPTQARKESLPNPSIHRPTTSQVIISERFDNVPSNEVDEMVMPVITKIETVEEPLMATSSQNRKGLSNGEPLNHQSTRYKCPECSSEFNEPLASHFLGSNRPMDEKHRCSSCKLVCPTFCSFQAHTRIHEKRSPYICPDCGDEFLDMQELLTHMDEVCFHMAKSVRFRCPGRRCGKIFASDATFGPHFKQIHIDTMYMCGTCKKVFPHLEDCEDHCLTHSNDSGNIEKIFSCSTCAEGDMNWQQLRKHLDFHCRDLSRCIYIFMCKFCKCYFRSVQTMATHLQNCKVQKTGVPKRVRSSNPSAQPIQSKYVSGQCKVCKNKIICFRNKPSIYCNKCLTHPTKPPFLLKKPPHLPSSDKCVCVLCKVQIGFLERRRHQQECRYAKPQVMVERLDLDKVPESFIQLNQSFSSSTNSDFDGSNSGSPGKHRGDSSDDSRPKKRHRPSKTKRLEIENDLTAEEPIPFDGTYQCRLCEYINTDRASFHDHIKVHRHISTAYQCMECGECFVVRPSLVKHLLHFHNISNFDQYFLENDCFDRGAVTELSKVVKAPYLANPVKENQCRVCMQQFDSGEEHDKHFRIHGMAFLMKNSI